MNEQHARPREGPWSEDRYARPSTPDQVNPTQQLPAAPFSAAQPFPSAQPFSSPTEPLAHEGGFPYGMPPAAPYRPAAPHGPTAPSGYPDPYIPQHLYVPPQPFPQVPYPPQFGYPPMQQTVFVQGGQTKRVNHGLHLILSILTAGLWLPVWIILAFANS